MVLPVQGHLMVVVKVRSKPVRSEGFEKEGKEKERKRKESAKGEGEGRWQWNKRSGGVECVWEEEI